MSNPYGADVTGAIYDGPTACPVKFAKIDATGAQVVVSPVAGKKIRVLSYVFVVSAATTVYFYSSAGTVLLTAHMTFPAGGSGVSAPYSPVGHFETLLGEGLTIATITPAVQMGGHVTYIEVAG